MGRIPTAARRLRPSKDEQNQEEEIEDFPSPRKQLNLASHILSRVQSPKLGRPPRDEEEKRAVFTSLAYLKAANASNRECAAELEVNERTIYNYLNDPLYHEIEGELQADAKQRGYTSVATVIYDAVDQLFHLMHYAGSEFVRFKAAEKLLDVAGYNMPREEVRQENRDEVARFLEIVKERESRPRVQVNVQINTPQQALSGASEGLTVESIVTPLEVPELVSTYALPQVLPGGRLPPLPEVG